MAHKTVKCTKCGSMIRTSRIAAHNAMHAGQARPASQAPRRTRRRRGLANLRKARAGKEPNPYGNTIAPSTSLRSPESMALTRDIRGMVKREFGRMQLANTDAGEAWARRLLHPMDDTLGGAAPIPDTSTADSTAVESRIIKVLSAPSGLTNADTWDVQIAVPPCVDLVVAYRVRKTGDAWAGNAWRIMDSTTGFVKPGLFRVGNGANEPAIQSAPDLINAADQFRGTHRGITCILNANALADQGLCTVAQYGDTPTTDNRRPILNGYEGGNTQLATHVIFNDVPSESAHIIAKVPQAGQWEARKGVYMPVYAPNPTFLYSGGSETTWLSAGDTNTTVATGDIVLFKPYDPDNSATFQYDRALVYANDTTGANAFVACSAGATNFNFGVIIFEGLSPSATLLVRTKTGVEQVPTASSPLAATTKPSPPEDTAALKVAHAIGRELPMAYEHKYNSFNLLLPLLQKAAAAIYPIARQWLVSKADAAMS